MISAVLAAALAVSAPQPVAAVGGLQSPAVAAPAPTPALRPDQVGLLRRTLDLAPTHGLPDVFTPEDLDAWLASADPVVRQRGEAALLTAAADYARAVRSGLLPLDRFPTDWAQRPAPFDAAGELARALAEDRLAAWFAALPPPGTAYPQLQAVLGRYEAIAAAGGWPAVPSGATLKPGAEDDRVPLLRRRLAVEDDTVPSGDGRRYDPPLSEALGRFQGRHGLSPTGVLDRTTLAELNVPVATRVDQVKANLERRRWAPRATPATRIEVNIAAAGLDYFRDGARALTMRTVVGRPADRTPIFSDMVEAVVLNPPWNVPTSIAVNEILPKARKDPNYLARNDFVVLPNTGGLGLQQQPGPQSALGRFKFDLPNRFNVYLHDTPVRSVFAGDRRALSHGCIRLEKPLELARLVLEGDARWGEPAIQAALASGDTVRAPLAREVPVWIAYWTVFVDDTGAVNFRPDLYGWDAKLIRLRGDERSWR